jgi:hypothetical protein
MNRRTFCLICSLVAMIQDGFAADEIHWTFTGQTSVTFDWRGSITENAISYGTASGVYGTPVSAVTPNPIPTSSPGPFWEAAITGLEAGTLYYYKIGNNPEHTFTTPPPLGVSDFTVYVEGDVGSTKTWPRVADVQKIIANAFGNGYADFVLPVGDLTYADVNGASDVDQHFNDVMLWSQDAAYMVAWGNHEWDASSTIPDNFHDYIGRFAFPNGQTSPLGTTVVYNYAPGEDWYWFDYGNVRFIAIPEPYSTTVTWPDWNTKVKPIMAAAQANPNIDFIVTYGHRPSYSCTSGDAKLKVILDGLAVNYTKYVLDLSGHHHFYERSNPSQTIGVTHIIAGTGHTAPSTSLCTQPTWSAFVAEQPGALKLHFTDTAIEGQFICASATSVCGAPGAVIDTFTIGTQPPDTTPPTVSMAAPANGATVSGTATVTANATDNVGVAGVQFKLDGANLGSEDTASPFTTTWDTTALVNGSSHNLVAVARDAAGNSTTSTTVTVTVNNATPPGGLTHQWKFDETSGTSALDSVGANNATLTSPLWVAGKIGNAASFNGTNASGTAGLINFGTGNFTVAHWVKVAGFKDYAGIFNNRSSATGNVGFQTRLNGTSSLTAFIDFGATTKSLAVTNAVVGTWYHVAVSVDRVGLMKLYVNGVVAGQVDISAFSATSLTNKDAVRIGRDQASDYLNGAIDDLRLYDKVLSATEVLALFNQTAP